MVIGLPLATVMGFRRDDAPPASQPPSEQAFGEQLRSAVSDGATPSTREERVGRTPTGERRDSGGVTGNRQASVTSTTVTTTAGGSTEAGVAGVAARVQSAGPGPLATLTYPAPPPPPGIANAANLYNDVYGDLPPLEWQDPEFQARLTWVQSQVPFTISSWSSTVNLSPFSAPLRTSMMFQAVLPNGAKFDFDVRSLMQNPELVVYRLKTLQDPGSAPLLKPFPGLLAVQPRTASPLGERWEDPSFGGRTMFRATPERSYAPGDVFETPEGRFEKVQFGVDQTGEIVEAWEQVYRR